MFKMIRCGRFFDPVIMVTPSDAQPNTSGAKYFRYASRRMGNNPPNVFCEIYAQTAMSYFIGHTVGMGLEIPPERTFETLEEAVHFIQDQASKKDEARGGEENASVDEQMLALLGVFSGVRD